MTAFACLRVLMPPTPPQQGGGTLAASVSKVVLAYLEGRWQWPRRHGEISEFAFLLADPGATELNPLELASLSRELHLKLFGTSAMGEICMVMLEGDSEMITRFAAINVAELRRIISDGGFIEGIAGRITEITPQGARVVSPPDQVGSTKPGTDGLSEASSTTPPDVAGIETNFRAIWNTSKQAFIGNGLGARPMGARSIFSIIDGPDAKPRDGSAFDFDIASIKAAEHALRCSLGFLFLPISFSSFVQRTARKAYTDALDSLPVQAKVRLAAAVYDVPRAPSAAAMHELRTILEPYFSVIDLQIDDANFEPSDLKTGAVTSITFSLPNIEDLSRRSEASRFMSKRDDYKNRRIWQAISNVRTRRDIEFCINNRVLFLSGRGVSGELTNPVKPVYCEAAHLPWKDPEVVPG